MKKTKIALLTLALLGLVGCTRNDTSSVKEQTSVSDTPTVSTNSSNLLTSSTESSLVAPVSSPVSSAEESSEEASSSSSYNPYSEGWDKNTTDTMMMYLGGAVLPYIDLGKSIDASWAVSYSDVGVLIISGTAEWKSGTGGTIETYKASLAKHPEWVISKSTSKELTADNATDGVHLKLSKDNADFIILSATYDEPYDLTAATDWDDDIKSDMTTEFGDVVPFVYLGTKFPTAEISSYSSDPTIDISGGKWNAQVLSDATTTLTAAGYTITATDSTTIKATGKASNGKDDFTITIKKYGYSVDKIMMEIVLQEGWDPDNSPKEWDQDTKDILVDDFGGHDLPYVYLGKKQTKGSWSSYTNSLSITGGTWNDQVLTLATTAFDGWNPVSSPSEKKFIAEKTFDNGDKISVTIKTNYNGKIALTAEFEEGYHVPTDAKWADSTITDFNSYLDGHADQIPYVYLNSTVETTSWNSTSSTLTVTGGTFNSQILTAAKTAFGAVTDASGNKVWTEVASTSSSYDAVCFRGTMADGCTMDITFTTDYTNAALMKIKFLKVYKNEGTEYDAATKAEMEKRLCGHDLPYFYLGVDQPTLDWGYSTQKLTIDGAAFQPAMLTAAKAAYDKDGWTTEMTMSSSTSTTPASMTAEKEFDDCYLSVEIKEGYSSQLRLIVSKEENYDASKVSDWKDDTKTAMTSNVGVVLPYVYLGTNYESCHFYDYSNELDIYGNCWNYSVLTNAKTVFESNGYSCDLNDSVLTAYKKDSTINGYVLVKLYKTSYGFPLMEVYTDLMSTTIPSDGAYATDVSASILGYTNNHAIPYIYMGTDAYKTKQYSSNFEVTGAEWSSDIALDAYAKLKADGWTCNLEVHNSMLGVTASKKFDDGSKVTLEAHGTYFNTGEIDITYAAPFVVPEGVNSWSSSISRKISKKLDGGTIPFVYLGTTNPQFTDRSTGFEITGEVWDDSIWDSAYNAFKADGWNVIWDYTGVSSYSNKRVYAQKEIGGKVCTAITSCYVSKPEIDVYYE